MWTMCHTLTELDWPASLQQVDPGRWRVMTIWLAAGRTVGAQRMLNTFRPIPMELFTLFANCSSVHVLWTNINSVPNLGFLYSIKLSCRAARVNAGHVTARRLPLPGLFTVHTHDPSLKENFTSNWTAIKHDNNRQCYNHFKLLVD